MILKDEILGKYQIHVSDSDGHVVKEFIRTVKNKKTGKDEPYFKIYGYFSNMENAIGKIISLKMMDNITVTDLKTYYEKLKEHKKQFEKLLSTFNT